MMERIESTPANSAKATRRFLIDPKTLDPDARRKRRVSANNAVSILRAALLLAWEAGKIVDDRGWRRPFRFKDGVRPRTDILTRQQFESLLAVADAEIKTILIGLFYTGCRITELLSIQAGDLLADRLAVYIRAVKKVEAHYVSLLRHTRRCDFRRAFHPSRLLVSLDIGTSGPSCRPTRIALMIYSSDQPLMMFSTNCSRMPLHGGRKVSSIK
jgi:integrase